MKFVIVVFIHLFFIFEGSSLYGQEMCFWVANESDETFASLRIREKDVSYFGDDLLPNDMIDSGEHFWVKTYAKNSSIYDVEITRLNGEPLRFKWEAKNGKIYSRPYITLDILPLNTLMITTDDDGNIAWDISNNDKYGYGDPCDP